MGPRSDGGRLGCRAAPPRGPQRGRWPPPGAAAPGAAALATRFWGFAAGKGRAAGAGGRGRRGRTEDLSGRVAEVAPVGLAAQVHALERVPAGAPLHVHDLRGSQRASAAAAGRPSPGKWGVRPLAGAAAGARPRADAGGAAGARPCAFGLACGGMSMPARIPSKCPARRRRTRGASLSALRFCLDRSNRTRSFSDRDLFL